MEESGFDVTESCKLPPRVVVSAPQGRSGKTSIAMGICVGFKARGLTVQTFKKGPDYIDPSWLKAVSGRPCRNLDEFFMTPEGLLTTFGKASGDADISLIEGAMGLFDGVHITGEGTTARLARHLQAPLILVVNSQRMTYSVAAMVMGFQRFDPETRIAGVILNNVSGSRHEKKLTEAIEKHCAIPVMGVVPRDLKAKIAERHLGLIPFGERDHMEEGAFPDRVGTSITPYLNIDAIIKAAESAPDYFVPLPHRSPSAPGGHVRVGVFMDRVFNFYYPENLEALADAGAEVVRIDSIRDTSLPEIDGLYIGGGFPELFAPSLESNRSLRESVAGAVRRGMPVYAECAGLMYLCRKIRWQGEWYEMAGVIPGDVEMCERPQGHGYVEIEVGEGNPFFSCGAVLKGHEFHHSKLVGQHDLNLTYRVRRGHGVDGKGDGITFNNLFASYTHLHVAAAPGWARAFVEVMAREKGNSRSREELSGRREKQAFASVNPGEAGHMQNL